MSILNALAAYGVQQKQSSYQTPVNFKAGRDEFVRSDEMSRLMAERQKQQKKAERESAVNMLIEKISQDVKNSGINAKITGRAKHYYSIYKKMTRLNVAFHDLYDITAVRVIVDTEKTITAHVTIGIIVFISDITVSEIKKLCIIIDID